MYNLCCLNNEIIKKRSVIKKTFLTRTSQPWGIIDEIDMQAVEIPIKRLRRSGKSPHKFIPFKHKAKNSFPRHFS